MPRIEIDCENDLEAAILIAGGLVALAAELGVSRETVRLWRAEAMPISEDRAKQLEQYVDGYRSTIVD